VRAGPVSLSLDSAASAQGRISEQPKGAFLFEVHCHGGQRPDPADPAAKLGNLGARRRVSEYPQAERQGRRADVVALLDSQAERHGIEVGRPELAMPCGHMAVPVPDDREEAERLPVAQHPRRYTEPLRGLRYAHGPILTTSCQEPPPEDAQHQSSPVASDRDQSLRLPELRSADGRRAPSLQGR
jgi:hypothetical protein